MKVYWLNPERTRARLVKGWRRKRQAVVQVRLGTLMKCPCMACILPSQYIPQWEYVETGRLTSEEISAVIYHNRRKQEHQDARRANKILEDMEWKEYPPLIPKAIVIKLEAGPPVEGYLDNIAW